MQWFIFSVITLLCWSGSDFFSKIGCRDARDKYSHLKMVMAVGLVMGLHACYEIFFNGVIINWNVILTYLPVSLLYILSMAMGYIGLRYIELSISSPICNSSGALVAIATILIGGASDMVPMQFVAVGLACAGVVGLGFVEAREDEALRAARQEASNYKYSKSWLALALPIAYCLLDAAGTFADSLVLETLHLDFLKQFGSAEYVNLFQNGIPETLEGLVAPGQQEAVLTLISSMEEASANSANVAYELTFLAAGLFCFVYTVIIKKQKLVAKMEAPKYVGAIFETAGQFTYIFALSDAEHVAMSAPIISAYCAASVLWSRLFLKEKLSWKHYLCIGITVAGIIIMGVFDM